MRAASLLTLTAVLLLLPVSSFSQDKRSPRRARDICNEAFGRGDMDRCDYKIQQEAETNLNAIYGRLRSKLDERDRTVLEKSQQAWLAFRDANCELASDFVYRQCMTRMARERAVELLNYNSRFMQRH
jgi:uncharacterized protein YecT (DUF1311 family)